MTSGSLIRSAALFAGLAAAALAQENLRYYQAIRANDLTALRALVKAGGANARDDRGTTPLHYAAAYGSIEAMRFLLGSGAGVDARNDFEATPLMWAATEPEKVRLLVERGADVNAKSKMVRTAVWLAAANDMATVRLLLEKGAKVNVKDPNGATPLVYAAANGNARLIELLLARGAGVNAVTNAAIGGQVKHGAIAMGSLTPLLAAATYGSPEILKQLLDAGAGIDHRDVRGMTSLMLAVTSDSADPRAVRLLLDRGADPKIKDRDGLTAADWGQENGKSRNSARVGNRSPDFRGGAGHDPGLPLGTARPAAGGGEIHRTAAKYERQLFQRGRLRRVPCPEPHFYRGQRRMGESHPCE